MKLSQLICLASLAFIATECAYLSAADSNGKAVVYPIEKLDLSNIKQEWGKPQAGKSIDGNTMSIAGYTYDRGFGTHAESTLMIDLDGHPATFSALVGLDDETSPSMGSVEFLVIADDQLIWKSGVMRTGDRAKECRVDLKNCKRLILQVDTADNGNFFDHANWADATLTVHDGATIKTIPFNAEEPYILTPKAPATPRINGAKIFGVRPGHPFLYRIPATGERPMTFEVKGLPKGLTVDKDKGIITGKLDKAATTEVTFVATNKLGKDERPFKIVCGDKIALTPPMGWNSWNCFASNVSEEKIRSAAKAMDESGLADYGYSYINIDDFWSNRPGADDPDLLGPERQPDGNININKRFKDMKALYDYIHSLGLKGGIYSSPGPYTCGRCVASYDHEFLDAKKFEEWGVDYIKYDWCTYNPDLETSRKRPVDWDKTSLGDLTKLYPTCEDAMRPYILMSAALKSTNRDILFSLCQYGSNEVWKWGDQIGGNCWRTTGDIYDSWKSMRGIWQQQEPLYPYSGPGHWNDPDMLIVGKLGWGNVRPCNLTASEQYTHISVWALLNAPLLLGCDLTQIDDFTMNVIANNEIIDVNQDALGKQAKAIVKKDNNEVWAKDMEDGSIVIGLFETSKFDKSKKQDLAITWKDAGLDKKPSRVRDLWRQQDIKDFGETELTIKDIPFHGCSVIRVWK